MLCSLMKGKKKLVDKVAEWTMVAGLCALGGYMMYRAADSGNDVPTTRPQAVQPAPAAPQLEQLAVFPGYESPQFQQHDRTIIAATSRWNREFSHLTGYTPLESNFVKALMLVESGGMPNAWANDPMQLANQGDTGLDDLVRTDGAHLIPGYRELALVEKTPRKNGHWAYEDVAPEHRITPELSITFGMRYLFQKAMKFDYSPKQGARVAGMRPWRLAAVAYNGKGDRQYLPKLLRLLDSINTTNK
jgi:hypothetical protein